MEVSIVEKTKGMMEIEFSEKEVAISLVGALLKEGVDAYWYDPHPLMPGFRVHVDAAKPEAAVKKATTTMKKAWTDLKKQVIEKL